MTCPGTASSRANTVKIYCWWIYSHVSRAWKGLRF